MDQRAGTFDARYLPYLPRLVLRWADPSDPVATFAGTLVFADVSGFTRLSEELAQEGKVGSERVTDLINGAFGEMLTVARLEGGDILGFGGDSMLILFEGPEHERRALTAAYEMRAALAAYQEERSPVPLGVSMGVASGPLTACLAGTQQVQLFMVGATADRVVELEAAAGTGVVVASAETLAAVEPLCRGEPVDGGFTLATDPEPSDVEWEDPAPAPVADLARYVPDGLHEELSVAGAEAAHRLAVVGFLRIQGFAASLEEHGLSGVAATLTDIIDAAYVECGRHGVTMLASDIDLDGAKLIFTAGAPRSVSDPEGRMIRMLHTVVSHGGPLRLHAGCATGHVFAGDLGAAFRRAYTVMGDTVNLAARLAGVAPERRLVTTWRTVDRLRSLMHLSPLPPTSLKGKSEPIRPVQVDGFVDPGMAAAAHVVRFVNRDQQLTQLAAAGRVVDGGECRRVTITGPSGIGKSALLAHFRAGYERAAWVFDCEEYARDMPYYVASILLRHALGISGSSPAEDITSAVAGAAPSLLPWVPLLALALDVELAPTPEVAQLDEAFKEAKLREVAAQLLETVVPPGAMIGFDNAQWMDAASRALIDHAAGGRAPLLWVFATRDESPDYPLARQAHVTVELTPMTDDDIRLVVTGATSQQPLLPHVVDEIVQRASGNPLYAYELARVGLTDQLPESVERTLAARIDQLAPRHRHLLRYAAVLGQRFELQLLAESLSALGSVADDQDLWQHLREFLTVSGDGTVRFNQPLVRDVAYEGLPYRERTELHRIVADTIERQARHRAKRFASLLALHYHAAGDAQKTWRYAALAGDSAAARQAPHEALVAYRRALDAAAQLEQVDAGERARIEESLGDAAELIGELSQAETAFTAALTRAGSSDQARLRRKLAAIAEKHGDYERASALLEQAMAAMDGSEVDIAARVELFSAVAGLEHRRGNHAESARWARRGIEADPDRVAPIATGHALHILLLSETLQGDPGRHDHAQEALHLYRVNENWAGLGKLLNNMAIDAYYSGDWVRARALYEEGRDASHRAGDVLLTATHDNNIGEIASDQGDLTSAGELFGRAEQIWLGAGYGPGIAVVNANLGRLKVRMGDAPLGTKLLEDALERFIAIGMEAFVAECQLRLAEAGVAGGDLERAHHWLSKVASAGGEQAGQHLRDAIQRIEGHARLLGGEDERGIELLQGVAQSPDADHYQRGLCLRALGLLGVERAAEEADRLLRELGALDAVILPLPA